jgi:hypothetical protein
MLLPTLRLLLGGAWLILLLAGHALAQNPVVPGQSPLRRLAPPPSQPTTTPPGNGPVLTSGNGLDSLRTLSGRYKALTPSTPTLVLFDVTAAYALPVGNFADSPAGGSATQGLTLALGSAYLFNRHVGVFGLLSGGVQGVRNEAIYSRLALTSQNATDIIYGQAGWSHVAFVLGPQFTLPLGSAGKLAWDVRPGVGLVYAVAPRYNATYTDPVTGNQQHAFVSSAAAFAPAYQVGASLRVPLTERLGARLGADYFYTRPSFDNNDPSNSIILAESYSRRPIAFVQLAIGLVVRFE